MTLRRTESADAGDWIAPCLGSWGTASGVTPRGFEAYARVFHPVGAQFLRWEGDRLLNRIGAGADGDPVTWSEQPVTWAEIAERHGTTAHALMQWERILGGHSNPRRGENGWQYNNPMTGDVGARELAIILGVLGRATTTPDDCTAAVWEGWGGIIEQMPWEVLPAPELTLPSRTYLMYGCATADFTPEEPAGAEPSIAGGGFPVLNLLWPADRAWFVGCEIDFDSTVIGGSREAIDWILASDGLEAWEIGPDDSLAADADTVNR